MEKQEEYFNDRRVYTLSQVGKSLETVIAKNYTGAYYIKAEIIKLNYYPRNGHCYPELVEKEGDSIKAQMRAVIWSSNLEPINERFRAITGEPLKEGITILCLATIEYSGKYGLALHIQDIEPTYTLGELAKNKVQTINRLKKEGLFDANKELQMPLLPKRIAVISIETSKGYSDFTITLNQNEYGYKFSLVLFPSLLQGDKAVHTMKNQLDEIEKQKDKFDCVVIIRGGGGDVGLSCYDNYELARRVAEFPLPIVSGIGHSTNVTVVEMVSHETKITPTEVAYYFIQRFRNFDERLQQWQQALAQYARNLLKDERMRLLQVESRRQQLAQMVLVNKRRDVENLQQLLPLLSRQLLNREKEKVARMENSVALLHPRNILKRGFSVTLLNGKPVTKATELKAGDELVTQLHEGEVKSRVE
ncbi:MAG: exodeoxyribonuclease VII large subunit [Bacteroidales bacterium]|nr:exodeoxyribonuclease VII large subunit [Bacteroidales bacterium]